jgi:hypothetical protein
MLPEFFNNSVSRRFLTGSDEDEMDISMNAS